MWKYTKEKYNIPDTAQAWALTAIQSAWRKYKNWLKKKHYVPYANDELRMENRTGYILQSHFKDLLVYWNSKKSQKMSNINAENRKKLRYPHTVGKKSFAVIREEKKKEGPDVVTNKAIFVATRKRKPGRVYKDSYEDTIRKIVRNFLI
ncbi:uncharacterized protein LOC132638215 [Lycium barbarum]|uniref:uncharacterized protein LOC132638215 n=1 Tax=Lycium barbarum TaxID=112863 RepID=UPI00293F58F2|nr:uncharacterized protein LOC132638215 [Lycium barbarum]